MAEKPLRQEVYTFIYQIKQTIWKGIDWLFPPVCAGCGKARERFCGECISKTPRANSMVCVFCGEKPRLGQEHACPRNRFIDRGLVWGLHAGPLRKALHRFKYKRDLGLAEAFADLMEIVFRQAEEEVDLVVPVPLGKQRHKERGYNQADLLASVLSGSLAIEYGKTAVRRIRETHSQVGLSIDQRRQNVAGAFQAKATLVSGRRILLVDDVLTTGATLNACAQALKEAGARSVITLTLARAP